MFVAVAAFLLTQTLTKPPVLLEGAPPAHPAAAKDSAATVDLAIVIDEKGAVARVDVVTVDAASNADDFAWAALGAACGFVFAPAEVDGAAATVSVNQQLRFEPVVSATTEPPPTTTTTPTKTPTTTTTTTTFATGALMGRVRAQGTVVPLPASLHLSSNRRAEEQAAGRDDERDVEADEDGRFAVKVAEGPWHVEVSFTGHDASIVDVYVSGGAVEVLDVALHPREANGFETVVRAARTPPPVSRVSLSRAEVTGIPGTYGDALRVLESLPGVARAPLLGGALLVRGGLPADTQVMIEGVPVPTLYHFGGLRSVINGAFVEEIQFMPGGFPVKYGNATAGVVDVTTHALQADPFEAKFSVDLLDVGFFFGGTAKLSEVTALQLPDVRVGFAARRSHTEIPGSLVLATTTAFQLPLNFLPVPSWYDWQFKLESDVSDQVTLALFAFGAEDQFAFLGEPPNLGLGDDVDFAAVINALLGNRFTRYVGRATVRPIPGVTLMLQPFVGQTQRGLLADGVVVPLLAGDFFSPPQEQLDWGVRQETRARFAPWMELRMGLDAQQATTHVQRVDIAQNPTDPAEEPPLTAAFISSAAIWTDAIIEVGDVSIIPGLRGELSSLQFNDRDDIYDDGSTDRSIVDAVFVDPRLQVRWRPDSLLTLKGAVGTFHQRPRIQSAAFDIDGRELKSPQAVHVVLGLESQLADDLTLDAQVYTVRRFDLTRDRSRLFGGLQSQLGTPALPTLGSYDSDGVGDTEGFELLLRSKPRRLAVGQFFGWIAYTFSRSVVSLGDRREDEVPTPFDQTHNLIVVAKTTLPWDLTAGLRFAFVTGNPSPISDVVATGHDLTTNTYSPILSTLRPSRLPSYHRLDLRLEKTFVFDWYRVTPYVEVLNTYNWLNPEVLFPSGDYRQRELRVLLPGPPLLPLIGLEMTL